MRGGFQGVAKEGLEVSVEGNGPKLSLKRSDQKIRVYTGLSVSRAVIQSP